MFAQIALCRLPQPLRHLRVAGVSAVLLGLALAPARAQTGRLSLEDCVRLALQAPSRVSVARGDAAIAREQRTVARSELLPQVGVLSGLNYNSPLSSGPNPFSFVAANGVREYLTAVDATWQIDLSGRLRAGLALARAGRDLADADLSIAQRDIRRAVAVAYYDVLLARRLAGLEEEVLQEARDFERITTARQALGEASRADVYKASAQRSGAEQRVGQAQLNERLANQILASFWTEDADRELLLEDTFDAPPPLPSDLPGPAQGISERPEFDRFDALSSRFKAERDIARAGLRPQAGLVFQYGLDANNVAADQRGYAVYLNLRLPVFDWLRSRGEARQATYRQEQIEQQRAAAERGFSQEYLAARARLRSWHERIPQAESEFHDAQENLRLTRLLYENGEGPALEVVAAVTQVSQAGTAFYSAIAEYFRAQADYKVASGE